MARTTRCHFHLSGRLVAPPCVQFQTLWATLQDKVEGCLRGTAERRETGVRGNLAESAFTCLGAEPGPHFLRHRCRSADERRRRRRHDQSG